MSFRVDVISEDSFYENLVLGVTKLLEANQRVTNVIVERRLPVDRVALSSWEQRHSLSLPDDLRQFYLSTDGFKLRWSFQYSSAPHEDILSVGKININPLSDLILVSQSKELLDSLSKNQTSSSEKLLPIGNKSKIFELDDCKGCGKVCLIHYENAWSIWFLDVEGGWTWLADSFVYYFRMALVHQGLPGWQAIFTKTGLSPWAEQLVLLMAPHLLVEKDDRRNRLIGGSNNDGPFNHIDPTIFKVPVKRSTNTK